MKWIAAINSRNSGMVALAVARDQQALEILRLSISLLKEIDWTKMKISTLTILRPEQTRKSGGNVERVTLGRQQLSIERESNTQCLSVLSESYKLGVDNSLAQQTRYCPRLASHRTSHSPRKISLQVAAREFGGPANMVTSGKQPWELGLMLELAALSARFKHRELKSPSILKYRRYFKMFLGKKRLMITSVMSSSKTRISALRSTAYIGIDNARWLKLQNQSCSSKRAFFCSD